MLCSAQHPTAGHHGLPAGRLEDTHCTPCSCYCCLLLQEATYASRPGCSLVPITNVPGRPRVCSAQALPHHPDVADLGEALRENERRSISLHKRPSITVADSNHCSVAQLHTDGSSLAEFSPAQGQVTHTANCFWLPPNTSSKISEVPGIPSLEKSQQGSTCLNQPVAPGQGKIESDATPTPCPREGRREDISAPRAHLWYQLELFSFSAQRTPGLSPTEGRQGEGWAETLSQS